ncbi:[LysW]-aminoadipate kinase [Streptomyces sp. NPDC006638]|uniref:[LysW]-aminoadipate kinase n=1 Tax=unclassified Streptomyces TaxID=2593676 RepID=UPI0033A80F9B
MSDITVVKCGGNAAVDPAAFCSDVADLVHAGGRVVVVHGGSADIEDVAREMGTPLRTMTSPDGVTTRYTDEEALDIVTLALAGRAKPRLLGELVRRGVTALGMTGLDAGLLRARRKRAHRARVDGRLVVVRDNHSGVVTEVDTALLVRLLDAGVTPVISPPALAEDGRPVNADADRVAAAVAAGLDARSLVMLTGAPGVLEDPQDDASVIPVYTVRGDGAVPRLGGGMSMKLVAAREALRNGVSRVVIADGRVLNPLRAIGSTRVVLAGAGR